MDGGEDRTGRRENKATDAQASYPWQPQWNFVKEKGQAQKEQDLTGCQDAINNQAA